MHDRVYFGRAKLWIFLLALLPLGAPGQQTPGSAAELATSDSPAVFRVRTNAVLVRVVVRDQKGYAVENLKKEDFQLFDNKKLQTITSFNVVHPGGYAGRG